MLQTPTRPLSRQSGERLIYAGGTTGHRQAYLDTLGPIFALEPVSDPMSPALFRRLVAAECLLFTTLDDHMASFCAVTGMRSLLGRPTVALFLRAQKCFETGRWYYPLKRHAFRTLRRLPRLTVASITPFEVAPRHAEVAHFGVSDPQYWDLHDGEALPRPGHTSLSDEVLNRAAERPVLCALGSLSAMKGLAFLAETLERHPGIAGRTLVVGAGHVPAESAALAARLEGAGAMIIDRFVTDVELESLYGAADGIWSCYVPDYDQSSGVFGRAIQFGVPPIVREGSVIATFAATKGIGHLPVPYGAHQALAELLSRPSPRPEAAATCTERARTIAHWRDQFVETIGAALSVNSFGRSS